ncbi:hypothetical protein ANOBCDAF_04165 [Pleomorphomonas sp. T1.2MG-36]|nr:hypothetical protein ANOBCDAF_04165 [Pleomorphomonas sp. T1.2MG-36]
MVPVALHDRSLPAAMPLPSARNSRTRRAGILRHLAMALVCAPLWLSSGHAADNARRIAAELDVFRRTWTICTVNDVGRAVQRDRTTEATAIADGALARCALEEQALGAKAAELLGAERGRRLMERLVAEAREALVGSARTMQASLATGADAEPAWPRILAPSAKR